MTKSILTFLLAICQIHFCYYGNAAECERISKDYYSEKHYVNADQIVFCEEGFIIHLEELYLLAQAIFHDENGFYYLEDGVSWICGNCGALNDLDDRVCYRCGKS